MPGPPKIMHLHLPGWTRPWLFGLGIVLLVLTPVVGILPGPGGVFLFAGGMALVLKNSSMAKRLYVRFKARWPRLGGWGDWALRRESHRRRVARRRARGED
ncbi:hypothetical protein [Sphingomonas quercus]|nr:hypothetical protein [Sphingomonas quercus]